MKEPIRKMLAWVLLGSAAVSSCAAAQPGQDRLSNLDQGWRFLLGDNDSWSTAAHDDSNWRYLDVPHDWSIEGHYEESNPGGPAGAFLPTGTGWYRKHLAYDRSWSGKKVYLRFDGVYMNSDVWINGAHLGRRPYGYSTFEYDLTPQLHDGDNVIAVRVDNSKAPSGRWYTGSGIYRHVWLKVVDPLHIPMSGTFVTASIGASGKATLQIRTEVSNLRTDDAVVDLEIALRDPAGKLVGEALDTVFIPAGETGESSTEIEVPKPGLWSPSTPCLYTVEHKVISDGVVRDSVSTRTGIRTIGFAADRGFVLNGARLEIRGVSEHHTGGGVFGAAVPEDVMRYRLQLLKDMGVNAIRTAHNPFAPEFYDLADEIGFLVMDEAFDGWFQTKAEFDYGLYFEDWWQRDLRDFLRRDRNHPSVVIWSIGNEVPGYTGDQQKMLVDFVHEIDGTRPVTQGRGYRGGHLDVAGFNGHGEYVGELERFHDDHPDVPVVGTEITHSAQTRGVYRSKTAYRTRDNPAPWEKSGRGAAAKWHKIRDRIFKTPDLADTEIFAGVTPRYQSSYDNAYVRMNIRESIRLPRRLGFVAGTFRWTGFDYLGESFGWPARTANFGVIDLAGIPKDGYYLYQSQWTTPPMIHLLPHWTHPGKEGVSIPVVAWSNQPQAELFLDGTSLGKQLMGEDMQFVWRVPYRSGELRVIALNGDGEPVAADTHVTAGAPARISLTPSRVALSANGTDVVRVDISIVDARGTPVPDADNRVHLSVTGPATLVGLENGDILDLEPTKSHARRAFKGKLVAFLQATRDRGQIVLTVFSKDLDTAYLNLEVQ